jgi:4-diphosphocytidyl-2-C-methyl-D-erythritol kinase
LYVTRKRSDGFHDIETVFYPVPLRDALEVNAHHPAVTDTQITNYGLTVDGDTNDNLCIKAWRLLKKDFPSMPFVQIHLLKHIPMGAGLGGGSANGAFMLQLLNDTFQLGLSTDQLISYALQLGSDCPFFIVNLPSLATGRGETLSAVPLQLSAYKLVLVTPGIHINTGWAFSQLTIPAPGSRTIALHSIIRQPVSQWKEQLHNDFEPAVFAAHPILQTIKGQLYEAGAVYAAMSGSGSTVYGLFDKNETLPARLPAPSTIIDL